MFDIWYRDKRIEVKQTAYYHPFNELGKLSSIRRFGIQQIKEDDGSCRRENDIYIFCLLNGEDEESAWPLEVSHWEFYVVPTTTINKAFKAQKTVSLSRIREIAKSITYANLKNAVDDLIDQHQ